MLGQIDALILQRREAAEAGVAAFDGRDVRLGGYLLPTEIQGDTVTEFALLTWATACCHAPAPPANQSVRVRPAQPLTMCSAADPVWVSGGLRLRLQERKLSMIDGERVIRSTYAIDNAKVVAAPLRH